MSRVLLTNLRRITLSKSALSHPTSYRFTTTLPTSPSRRSLTAQTRFLSNRMGESKPALPSLPDIERLSPLVIRILAGNPGKYTLQGTNTYLVGTGPRRVLIDTGEGRPAWKTWLQKVLQDEGPGTTIQDIILTHWHRDHVGGVRDVLALCPKARVWKNQPDVGQSDLANGALFTLDGSVPATLRAFFCPGHARDHMALVLDAEDAMFTADNVLGHGTAVFEDLPLYLRSLEGMRAQFAGRAYPGHGAVVTDGPARINEYIAHRREREDQILAVLGRASGDADGWTSMQIVRVVYQGYPENLLEPAEGGVVQVLKKLEGEGRVKQRSDGESVRWSLTGKAAL